MAGRPVRRVVRLRADGGAGVDAEVVMADGIAAHYVAAAADDGRTCIGVRELIFCRNITVFPAAFQYLLYTCPLRSAHGAEASLAAALAAARGARTLLWAGCGGAGAARAAARAAAARGLWLVGAAPGALRAAAGRARGAVWADARCAGGRAALAAGAAADLLDASLCWLVADARPPPRHLPALRADSDLLWAQVSADGARARVWALWAPGGEGGRGGAAAAWAAGEWAAGDALRWRPPPPAAARLLAGQELLGAIVLEHTPLEALAARVADGRDRQADSISKHNSELFRALQRPLNFTLRLVATPTWGYPAAGGAWDGAVGLLQRKEVHLSVSCNRILALRLDAVDYTGPSWTFRAGLLFRQPGAGGGGGGRGGALLLPFSAGAWAAGGAAAAALTLALRLQRACERRHAHAHAHAPVDASWSTAALDLLGVVCLQGAAESSTWLSWRLLVLSAAAMALVMDSCYAAGVVTSLLLPPPASIHTKADLVASPLAVGAENMSYIRDYFQRTTDADVRELWRRKMFPAGRAAPNFLPVAEGVERVRTQPFAYHSEEQVLFPLVARSFSARARCSLGLIPLIETRTLFHPVQKRSAVREALTGRLRRAWEVGVVSRLNSIWHPRLLLCDGGGGGGGGGDEVEAVGVAALTPGFALVAAGAAVAALLLLVELRYSAARGARFF